MLSVANFHLRNCHSEKYAIFAMTVPNFSGAEKIADFINRDLERNVAAATPPATVDIIGLRRCGKTTFLRQQVETLSGEIRWFNCDYASDAEQLRIGSKSDAEAILRLAPNIVIDEAQRVALFGLEKKFDQILMINTFVRTRDGIKREHQFGIVVLNAGKRFKLALESLLTGKQVADLHVQARTRFFGNEVNFPAGFVAGSD